MKTFKGSGVALVTPFHTDGMIEDLIKALKEVMNEHS